MLPEKQDKENIPDIVDLNVKNARKNNNYRSEMLNEKHKEAVYKLISVPKSYFINCFILFVY